MDVNRIFICHTIRNEDQQDIQKLHYLIEVIRRAGLEILTDQEDDSAENFFPLLQQKLLTCQAFILLQTPDAVSAPRVRLAVRAARRLAKQKRMQLFRFIYSLETEIATSQEWKALTTFDGTHDYQRTSEKLVSAIAANAANRNTTSEAVTRSDPSTLRRISFLQTSSQTSPRWSQTRSSQTTYGRLQTPSFQTSGGLPQILPSVGAGSKPRTTIEAVGTRKGGGHNFLILALIALVILLVISSAGMLFFLSGSKSTSPPPSPFVGQVVFISSGQRGTDYNTGICDEIQVNLNHLTPPTEGKSYYAWLLPDSGHAEESPAAFLGRLTVDNGAASITYTSPKHENLLLTKSRFLITEEGTNSPLSLPSPDQHFWRYFAAIPQTPNPQNPRNYSYLDHVRHLLTQDPTLQQLGMQGGLSTWFYENVKSVRAWANIAQGAGKGGRFSVVHSNIISILDYLDGTNFVAGDVPPGTPITADPQISSLPILSLGPDPANQKPSSYIYHLEIHLQGLIDSPDATDAQRTLASKIDNELEKTNGILQQVRQDAKKLVAMSDAQMATAAAASLLSDLVKNTDSAFVGQLDPATNRRQGGATWVHDVIPQFAILNVKEASAGALQ
jgi:hypothetical protein